MEASGAPVGKFRFVSINEPGSTGDRKSRHLARSHAIKNALDTKRKRDRQCGRNFHIVSLGEPLKKPLNLHPQAAPLSAADTFEPFQTLVADSSKLQAWIRHSRIREEAAKPVFTMGDELVLQNFRFIFRTGLDDSALFNAALLTFSVATAGLVDVESLGYQNAALRSLRQRMGSPTTAATEATLATIILLAAIETRLEMPVQVQLHMDAIRQLLGICETQNIHLTDGIKRAIFWQDLNSSVATGSRRIVDHQTFSELRWWRDPFTPSAFVLPAGFRRARTPDDLLTADFVELLEDVHALQCVREGGRFPAEEFALSMARLDNQQASIQSRLASLPGGRSAFLECCRLGTYLCSALLRCRIWRTSVVPSHLSLRLLQALQQANQDPIWDTHPDVLIWLLYIGGAFAPAGDVRTGYMVLLRSNQDTRFKDRFGSWPNVLHVLREFIWSEKAFLSQVKSFSAEFSGWKKAGMIVH
ncbi:hypothetical protein F4778DRAFT_734284 [Xylariomycetidae sp. FL2044]|nr:hypothetical protein F4778DRAFT_734284 [Xylariomycetidae sp. FL2044]